MGQKLDYQVEEGIGVIQLDDGKANTIDPTWIEEMEAALTRAVADDCGALLVRGRERIFCAGLDLKVLPALPRPELVSFVAAYERIKTRLFRYPLPVVADVAGHALAGGAVLLLCADYAVTCVQPKRIGLNETQVGIPMPPFVVAMARTRLAVPHWTRAIACGEIYDPAGALLAGFVHEIAPSQEARSQQAWLKAKDLAGLPKEAFAASKAQLREPAIAAIEQAAESSITRFFATRSPS